MTNNYPDYKKILEDKNLTKEQKISLLEQAKQIYEKQLENDLKAELTKQRLGAALEIGSSAIPMGGVGNIGAKAGMEILKSSIGKKLSQEIGSAIASGLGSGAVFGTGRGLIENKNPIITGAQDAVTGAVLGGALGAGGGYVQKAIMDSHLRNYKTVNPSEKAFRKVAENNFKDYTQGRIVHNENIGDILFTRKGMDETLSKNPELVKQFPDLAKNIKNANYIETKPLYKERKDKTTELFHTLKKDNTKYYIAEDKFGNKKFYLAGKDATGQGTPSYLEGTSSSSISTNIIPNSDKDFNPPFSRQDIAKMSPKEFSKNEQAIMEQAKQGKIKAKKPDFDNYKNPLSGSKKIFTREQIGKMSKDEYAKHEKEIFAQMNEIGVPQEKEIQKSKPKSAQTSGKGRWVTINGNHVFIEE